LPGTTTILPSFPISIRATSSPAARAARRARTTSVWRNVLAARDMRLIRLLSIGRALEIVGRARYHRHAEFVEHLLGESQNVEFKAERG
jgi:hypothetical protein